MSTLSLMDARAVLLAAQGLATPHAAAPTKADVRAIIRQMHMLQIDTISVVARSPYLVLWSRLGAYDPRWLDELLEEGALFEYWAHAACFLPIEDYPYFRRRMFDRHDAENGYAYLQREVAARAAMSEHILGHVRANGAVRSADFERTDGKTGNWWNWKDEKVVLELLFDLGELMVVKRHNFQRVYDLRERVHSTWDDAQTPSTEVMERAFVLNTVRALGVAKAGWVADYYRLHKKRAVPLLETLVAEGALHTVKIGSKKGDERAYVHPDNAALIANPPVPTHTALLSPFDPVVWDRARALELFGFDYRIECYTPAPKRVYGYFTLPILHRGALVGRIDAKAHRKEARFEVKALHLEPGVPLTDELIADLAATLRACAAWHNTPAVDVVRADPPEAADLVRRAL